MNESKIENEDEDYNVPELVSDDELEIQELLETKFAFSIFIQLYDNTELYLYQNCCKL